MSATGPGGQSSKAWLIGAGAGCGCLSLAAAAVVILIAAGLGRGPGAAAPQAGVPQAAPPPPGAPPAGPAAQPGLQSAYQIQVFTVRIDAQRQSAQPADAFRVGETVGAVARFVSVPRAGTIKWFILRWNPGQVGQTGTIVTAASSVEMKPEMQGQQQLFTVNTGGAGPGAYGFVVAEPGAGNQLSPIASHNFQLQ